MKTTHTALMLVNHDGRDYEAGETIELTKSEAAALLAAGVVSAGAHVVGGVRQDADQVGSRESQLHAAIERAQDLQSRLDAAEVNLADVSGSLTESLNTIESLLAAGKTKDDELMASAARIAELDGQVETLKAAHATSTAKSGKTARS